MNIIGRKNLYFFISLVILIPGLISLATKGLRLSIDFTGGSVFEFEFRNDVKRDDVIKAFHDKGVTVESIQISSDRSVTVKTKPVDNPKNDEIVKSLQAVDASAKEISFESVGPLVGKETTTNAFIALIVASIGILLYIAYAFRSVPKPYSSFRFGASAIIALLHDAFVVLGVFSILGFVKGVEIDALFITAILTVIGFSVHDTIVVFDRIRENLDKLRGSSFSDVVNFSLVETLNRSLRTSLTVIFTLLALFLLGGETIKYFVVALLVGIVSGTYSSIFNASPILVVWEEWAQKRRK